MTIYFRLSFCSQYESSPHYQHGSATIMAMKSRKDSSLSSNTQSTEAVILTKQVTLLDCTVLIIGTVIGSGIFISPKAILDNTGSVGFSLIVWLVCGAFSCVGALCYAELASSIPESGGDYSYLRHSFGPWVSFLRVWTSLLAIRTGGIAVVIRVAARSLLIAFGGNCGDNWTTTTLLSIVMLGELRFLLMSIFHAFEMRSKHWLPNDSFHANSESICSMRLEPRAYIYWSS